MPDLHQLETELELVGVHDASAERLANELDVLRSARGELR